MRWRMNTPVLLCAILACLLDISLPEQYFRAGGQRKHCRPGENRSGQRNYIAGAHHPEQSRRHRKLIYTDNEGRFGFNQLPGNLYHLVINEDGYAPIEQEVAIDPVTSSMQILTIYLVPREAKPKAPPGIQGGNTRLADSAQYTQQIPKPARKEFEKGVKADKNAKPDDAIKYYQKAVTLSPQFYEARNNLGTDLVSKSRFPEAQEQFEQVVKMNPSDAAAYFNLGNVSLLTRQFDQGQHWVEQGLSKQPDPAFGHFLQGSLYAQHGQAERGRGRAEEES